MNTDDILELSVLIKIFQTGEPISTSDFNRFIDMMGRMNLQVDSVSPEQWAGMRTKFVQLIQQKFMGQGNGK